MKKLFIIMVTSILMVACNNETDTTDSTSDSGDSLSMEPATVDSMSSGDTTTRMSADSAIRK